MKIFAIINNYLDRDSKEPFFGGELSWYEMPDSSIIRSGNPFFVPDFDNEFMAFPSVVYRIGRLGKSISCKFAYRYTESAAIGAAVIATGVLRHLRERGLPWSQAVSFDRSCMLGNLEPIDTLLNNKGITIRCGEEEIVYRTDSLLRSVHEIIEIISKTHTLKNGDLLLAGLTPSGFILKPGSRLTARNETIDKNLIDINIK